VEQFTNDRLAAGRAAFERHEWAQAVELLSAADDECRLDADDLTRLAEASRWSSHYDTMFNSFERAESAYVRGGQHRRAARIALELCFEHYLRNQESACMGWAAHATSLLETDTECIEFGLLRWGQARLFLDGGMIREAAELLEETLTLSQRIDAPELEALARQSLGHVRIIEGDVPGGLRLIDESNALAMSGATSLWAAGMVYCSTIWACRNIGDWRRASEWTDSSLRWCEREAVSHFPGLCRFHRAEVLRVRGSLDDAERDALAAIDELMAANPRDAPWAYGELGEIRRRRGDLQGAERAFRKAVELGHDPQPGLALLRLAEGKPEAALRSIVNGLSDASAFALEGRAFLLPAQVTIAIAAGDLGLARQALDELEERAEISDSTAFRASASCAAGELALAQGDAVSAVASVKRGLRQWQQMDAPFEAAHARLLLARAHRELGADDDARFELEMARDAFGALGATDEVHKAANLLNAPFGATRKVRTFLFSDIVDSTKLVDVLGDEAWESMLAWHDRTLRACFEACAGEEIKHEGDGFFVAFTDARAALRCAVSMQRTLAAHRREHGFAPQVRVGVHTAEATARAGDFTGRGVHIAARVAAGAGASEIVATIGTVEDASDDVVTTDARAVELKGLSAPVEVVTVAWQE